MNNGLENKPGYWERSFKKEWSYTAGAVMLSILATILLIVTGKAWGVTGPFAVWGGKLFEVLGVSAERLVPFTGDQSQYSFFQSVPSVTNVGIILGALMATLLAASFKFKKFKSWRQVAAAILGGSLMGIGARLALGCNIGAMFSAIPAFSLHGWVFVVFIFSGAAVGSFLLKKVFM